jgi:hypothetical protein
MAIHFTVFPDLNLLLSEFEGVVNPVELLAWYEALRSHDEFRTDIRQLADFRRNVPEAWTADEMKRVLEMEPFGEGARRAFVGPSDVVFGLARMYASFSDTLGRGGNIEAFRDMDEALEWLGVDPTQVPGLA